MPAPNLGPQYDLAARISALEDQLRRLQQNPLGQAFSATQSDGSVGMQIYQNTDGAGATSTLWRQGPRTARDPNTNQHPPLMYIGELFSGGVSVDSGIITYRPDGSSSAVIGNRGVQLQDHQAHAVVQPDETAGIGLNTPWIPLGQPVGASPAGTGWPNTTSTTMAEVALLAFPAQHSQITWYGLTYLASGSGAVQIALNNGAAGATHSVGAGFTYLNETMPLGTWYWQEVLQLTANAQVMSGAGPLYFAVLGVWGCGTG